MSLSCKNKPFIFTSNSLEFISISFDFCFMVENARKTRKDFNIALSISAENIYMNGLLIDKKH